jgi:hypothetical protein
MCGEHLLVGGIEWRARERAQIHREQIVPKARYGDLARVFTAPPASPARSTTATFRLLRKDSGLVDAPGRGLVGATGISPF